VFSARHFSNSMPPATSPAFASASCAMPAHSRVALGAPAAFAASKAAIHSPAAAFSFPSNSNTRFSNSL